MNQVSLVGRITHSPELKQLHDGNTVTKFNLAIDRYLAVAQKEEKKNEGKQTADFPRVVVWGKQAENCCKYLSKGALISVVGRVSTSTYEKETGESAYVTEIIGDRIHFLENVQGDKQKTD